MMYDGSAMVMFKGGLFRRILIMDVGVSCDPHKVARHGVCLFASRRVSARI